MIKNEISFWQSFIKRSFDLFFSVLIIVLITPIFLLVALLVKIDSKGPVFFRQTRAGLNGKPFYVYKFRTMHISSENSSIIKQAMKDDVRVTRIGAFLRRTSLDELPEFLNVIKGEMSLVGPRPLILTHVEHYSKYFSFENGTTMKPGMTGWAQVAYHRGEISSKEVMEEVLEHDNYYERNWSLLFDLRILALTFINAFSEKNAY